MSGGWGQHSQRRGFKVTIATVHWFLPAPAPPPHTFPHPQGGWGLPSAPLPRGGWEVGAHPRGRAARRLQASETLEKDLAEQELGTGLAFVDANCDTETWHYVPFGDF